jgi:thiamine biosynthesis lipoprotein
METRTFHAMGTEVEVLGAPHLPHGAVNAVQEYFETVEAALSRFRPDSELSLLNLAAGRPFAASAMLQQVLGEALAAAEASGGLFDPTVLHAVRAAGYRESIETVRGRVQVRTAAPGTPCWRDIEIADDGTVTLPPSCGVDLGGFAKGWSVDRAARLMAGSESWVINAGGDLLAHGGGPDGLGWVIGIEDPFGGPDVGMLRVVDGAVATSTTQRRRWLTQDGVAHHIIDPRTGLPSDTDLAAVTVLAVSVAEAEVLAKTVLLLGKSAGRAYAEERRLRAVLVDETGSALTVGRLEECLVV